MWFNNQSHDTFALIFIKEKTEKGWEACRSKNGLHLELRLYVLHWKMETNEQWQGDNDSYGDKSPYESDILVLLGRVRKWKSQTIYHISMWIRSHISTKITRSKTKQCVGSSCDW